MRSRTLREVESRSEAAWGDPGGTPVRLALVGLVPFMLAGIISGCASDTERQSARDASMSDADGGGAASDASTTAPHGDASAPRDASGPDPCGQRTGWQFDATGERGTYPSLAIAPSGFVHVVFFREGGVHHATNASGSWLSNTIAEDLGTLRATSLAIDDQGHLHVAFGQVTGSNTYYATNRSGVWETERIDSAGLGGAYPRVRIHPDGYPVIVYRGGPHDTTTHLRIARPSDMGWDIESHRVYAENPDFELTPAGTLHLLTNPTATRPTLRYWNDASDELEGEIVAEARPGVLALAPDETVHLAYTLQRARDDADHGALIHSWRAPGDLTWLHETLLPAGGYIRSSGERTMALLSDGNGSLHFLYELSDDPCNGVRYATNASGDWHTTVLNRTGRFDAIIHDDTLHVVISGEITHARLDLRR